MKTNRLGETKIMSCGMKATIIKYKKYRNIRVRFEDGYEVNNRYDHFIKGAINNPYVPSVLVVGYIGDTKIDKKSHKVWSSMLSRCYNKNFQEREPSYKGCKVCDEWLCYANFKEWYDKNIYEIENENIQLDKDILVKNNKVYSPDTCIFVPNNINILFTSSSKGLPLGVFYNKENKKYKVLIKSKFIGYFNTIEEAEKQYNIAKYEYIKEVAEEYKYKIPDKLYNKLIEISNKIN